MRKTFKELRNNKDIPDEELASEEKVKTSLAVVLSTAKVEITQMTKVVDDLAGTMSMHT